MQITQNHKGKVQADSLNGIAKLAVEIVGKHFFEVQRGATRWLGFEIAFGNDGYHQQESTRKEVELFVRFLDSVRVRPLAFMNSADGDSGVLLLDGDRDWDEEPSIAELDDSVWLCHWISGLNSQESVQRIRGFDPELISKVVEAFWSSKPPTHIYPPSYPPAPLFIAADTPPHVASESGYDIGGL